MRSDYDFTTGAVYKYLQSDYKDKMKQIEEVEHKKELEAAHIEAAKQDQRLEIISTMKPTVADINSNIEVLNCRTDNQLYKLEKLENRICALEISAADRSWRPNRKAGKLRITVRA